MSNNSDNINWNERNENNKDEKFYDINISLVLPKISIRFVFLVTNTEKKAV